MTYRPWGNIDWALSLSPVKKWFFIGTFGTEERSLCTWRNLHHSNILKDYFLIHIRDTPSNKYDALTKDCINKRHKEYKDTGGELSKIHEFDLMSELFEIQKISQMIPDTADSVLLDITSMPKRFFFPLLKFLTLNDNIKNLVVTYTCPKSYTRGSLYEDIDIWKNLPGFGGESTEKESLIVSIGFLVESLKGYFSSMPDHGQVNLLIPFPAPLDILKRTWESVSNIEKDQNSFTFDKYRVETLDTSAAFNRINSIASEHKNTAFAPFGPKPTSVAMCLYAIQKNCSVYYPQPTVYHPNYSTGIRNNNPNSATNAYWIKHNGENFYDP